MLAKLAQLLTNGRNRALPHRPAALLKLVVNSQVKAAVRPQPRRLTLVCRWRALPGGAALTCAWGIEVLDRVGQPVGPARRPAAVLVVGDNTALTKSPSRLDGSGAANGPGEPPGRRQRTFVGGPTTF
jgi:hypothetical protein